jgi:photosystem II stability/assembly factor-like uncharacterized protein
MVGVHRVAAAADGSALLVGAADTILTSLDFGATWERRASALPLSSRLVWYGAAMDHAALFVAGAWCVSPNVRLQRQALV